MSEGSFDESQDEPALPPLERAQVASLDAVRDGLVADAKGWAARIAELSALAARAAKAGAQTRRTLALELGRVVEGRAADRGAVAGRGRPVRRRAAVDAVDAADRRAAGAPGHGAAAPHR